MSDTIAVKPEPSPIFLWEPALCGKVCEPVTVFDDHLKQLVGKMVFTMRACNGIGLAAPQIGVFARLAVVHDVADETHERVLVLCNPEVIESAGTQVGPEGCLSIPGTSVKANVKRLQWIKFTYQDVTGEKLEMEASGLQARAVLHETNHLDGTFFIDHLSNLKRDLILRSHRKWCREQEH